MSLVIKTIEIINRIAEYSTNLCAVKNIHKLNKGIDANRKNNAEYINKRVLCL